MLDVSDLDFQSNNGSILAQPYSHYDRAMNACNMNNSRGFEDRNNELNS